MDSAVGGAVAVVGGAAVGMAVAMAAGKRGGVASVAALAGAVVGLGCSSRVSALRREPWWHDKANVRTFEDVAKEDAEFRAQAQQVAFDASAEVSALQRLFDGASRSALEEACASHNQMVSLADARARWLPWKGATAHLGTALYAVIVTELDAPHLQPTSIEKRLQGGVHAARFGLFALMKASGLDPPSSGDRND